MAEAIVVVVEQANSQEEGREKSDGSVSLMHCGQARSPTRR